MKILIMDRFVFSSRSHFDTPTNLVAFNHPQVPGRKPPTDCFKINADAETSER